MVLFIYKHVQIDNNNNNDDDSTNEWKDSYYKFCKEVHNAIIPLMRLVNYFSQQVVDHPFNLLMPNKESTDVSWKEVEWDYVDEQIVKRLLKNEPNSLPSEFRGTPCACCIFKVLQ